jgi:hypothetical protein
MATIWDTGSEPVSDAEPAGRPDAGIRALLCGAELIAVMPKTHKAAVAVRLKGITERRCARNVRADRLRQRDERSAQDVAWDETPAQMGGGSGI